MHFSGTVHKYSACRLNNETSIIHASLSARASNKYRWDQGAWDSNAETFTFLDKIIFEYICRDLQTNQSFTND